jgi:hypothetical protein
MRTLLELKFEQCRVFRDALRETGNAILLHSTYQSDAMWATGLHHRDVQEHVRCLSSDCFPGENLHGVLLMELRSKYFGSSTDAVVVPRSSVGHSGQKPPSLLDVVVDPRFVLPWFVKHGYYGVVPEMSHIVKKSFRDAQVNRFASAPHFRQACPIVHHA